MNDFSINLYDHQKDALKRMKNGCILCGDVGSGKSRTAIGYYFIQNKGSIEPYREMQDPCDLYIITTARKRDTFEWLGDMSPYLLSIDPVINNYKNKIVVDSWNNIKKYVDVENAFFIFDEQRVVGYGAWTKTFLKITKKNKWILLTATPGDQWTDYIPVFIANGFYKNKTDFLQQHAVFAYNTTYPKIIRFLNTGKLLRYRNAILIKMKDKRKTVRHYHNVEVSYDEQLYKKVFIDRWNIYEDEPIENISKCCALMRKVVNTDSSRIASIKYLTAEHPKVIIFYNYDYELDMLKNIEYLEGTEIAEWNGHEHEPLPTGDRWIYLVQYAAGCEGWNCTTTDTIIFYSQNYSYRTTMQAAGRIDRMTTPYKDLYYYTLKSKAPIDVAISRALKRKENFNESAFFS